MLIKKLIKKRFVYKDVDLITYKYLKGKNKMSEHNRGKVIKLFVSLRGDVKRETKDQLIVDVAGVEGDKFYGKDENRLILITSTDAYKIAKENNIDLEQGDLGENILIEGSIKSLYPGDRLNIGEAVLEITQNCTLCNGLSTLDAKLPALLKDDRGIFAKSLGNRSVIKLGDEIKKDTF